MVVTGAVIQGLYSTYLDFLGNEFLSAPMLFIIVGVVIFLVAFFGCCGAVRENSCMMLTFSVFLGLIFVCELAGGIAAYVLRGEVNRVLKEAMTTGLGQYNATGHGGVTETWDVLQHEVQCCGVEGFKDWANTTIGVRGDVPDSCCIEHVESCGKGMLVGNITEIWTDGCLPKLSIKIEHNAGIFAGIGVGVALVQLVGIGFSCMLSNSIRRNYQMV